MGLLDQVNSELATLRRRNARFGLDQLEEYFSFGGNPYPVVQTTMGTVNEESITSTAVGAIESSSPVFSLVLNRLQAFSQVRFQWTRFVGSQPSDLFGTPELSVLERPWPGGTTSDLLARMEIHASGAGQAYVIRPKRDRLSFMRPDRVTIVMGSETDADNPAEAPDVELAGYIHTTSKGKATFFEPNEVAHYAPIPHPNSVFLGMSWITAAMRELQADALMTEHKYRFMINAATPNLAIKFDPQITRDQVLEFKAILESEHRGAWNAYKCLAPDTEVAMWDGRRLRADEVHSGAVVVAWADGRAVPGTVSRAEWQPPSPIITIRTQRGRVIRTNDRHPFLARRVIRNRGERGQALSKPDWVEAAALLPGDLLTAGLGWARDDLPDEMTAHEAWALGLVVGDGCTVSSTPVVSAWDPGVRARLAAGYELRHTGKGHDYRVLGIRALCARAGLMGKRAWEKRVPSAVLAGSAKNQAAFVAGLVDADGHVADPASRKSAEIGITSTSRELLKDVQHILAGLGVNASLSAPRSMAARVATHHQGWTLNVHGNDQAAILHELLDLACPPKASRLAEYAARPSRQRRSLFDRVVSVEIGEPEPTIGLEIADHHTHVTGGVVTHNTLYLGGGADPVVVGKDFRQLDFSATQGKGESRLASNAGVPPSWVGFSEGLQGSALNAGNFTAARRRFADGTMNHLWTNAATSLEVILDRPRDRSGKVIEGASLWFDGRVPFTRDDAADRAKIQQQEAQTITGLVRDGGFTPDSVKKAVANHDWNLLQHSGWYSVQLQPPPPDGQHPTNGSPNGQPKQITGVGA